MRRTFDGELRTDSNGDGQVTYQEGAFPGPVAAIFCVSLDPERMVSPLSSSTTGARLRAYDSRTGVPVADSSVPVFVRAEGS